MGEEEDNYMSQRFLKYETEAENGLVDEHGVLKQTSSKKNKIALFENVSINASTWNTEGSGLSFVDIDLKQYSTAYPSLCEELSDGSLWLKYRLVMFIKNVNYNNSGRHWYTKIVTEFDHELETGNGYVVTTGGDPNTVDHVYYICSNDPYVTFNRNNNSINMNVSLYLEEV